MRIPKVRLSYLRLADFPSLQELTKASLLFKEDKEFQNIPWDSSPPISIVTSLRGITLLKKRGLSFEVKDPIPESGLTPEQKKACKESKALVFRSLFGVRFYLEKVSVVFEKGGNFYVKK